MSNQPGVEVRYSQGKKDIGDARNFGWEFPVPDTEFWRDLYYSYCRTFLSCFTPEKLQRLAHHFDETPPGTDKTVKMELLIRLLEAEIKEQNKAAAGTGQTFHDVDYKTWSQMWSAISSIRTGLEQFNEAEVISRMLHDTRRDVSNLGHQHSVAFLLIKRGEFAEAEEMEIEVLSWLEERAGKDSPQALATRRNLVEAKWKQERKEDAEVDLAELQKIVDRMGDGKYAVYKDSEVKSLEDLTKKLHEN